MHSPPLKTIRSYLPQIESLLPTVEWRTWHRDLSCVCSRYSKNGDAVSGEFVDVGLGDVVGISIFEDGTECFAVVERHCPFVWSAVRKLGLEIGVDECFLA
jgi:hypothetical protein